MDPLRAAQFAAPIIEQNPNFGPVVVSAAICISGLVIAVVVLWRRCKELEAKSDASVSEIKKIHEAHFQRASSELQRQKELDRMLAQFITIREMVHEDRREPERANEQDT
jgi:hypothetical protein